MSEVWMRNPLDYVRECIQAGAFRFIADGGYTRRRNADFKKYLEMYLPAGVTYRAIVVTRSGAKELRRDSTNEFPTAVYPVWNYETHTIEDLERELAEQGSIPLGEREHRTMVAVEGQEHRVVVTNWPRADTVPGKGFLNLLMDMQSDYPECIIHLHGAGGFGTMFGRGFRSTDINPRPAAKAGDVHLPNGVKVGVSELAQWKPWVEMLGTRIADLRADPKQRCIYSVKSALWAADNYASPVRPRARRLPNRPVPRPIKPPKYVDPMLPQEATGPYFRRARLAEGDRFACNQCTMAKSCRLYRVEGVCAISGSDGERLSALFNTRNADKIIEGLGRLMEKRVQRTEDAMSKENMDGEHDKHVTAMLRNDFNDGVKLAKLVDPRLAAAGATKVQISLGGERQVATPQALVANVVAQLEEAGYSRDQITDEMVAAHIANVGRGGRIRAIEASTAEEL